MIKITMRDIKIRENGIVIIPKQIRDKFVDEAVIVGFDENPVVEIMVNRKSSLKEIVNQIDGIKNILINMEQQNNANK